MRNVSSLVESQEPLQPHTPINPFPKFFPFFNSINVDADFTALCISIYKKKSSRWARTSLSSDAAPARETISTLLKLQPPDLPFNCDNFAFGSSNPPKTTSPAHCSALAGSSSRIHIHPLLFSSFLQNHTATHVAVTPALLAFLLTLTLLPPLPVFFSFFLLLAVLSGL